MAQMQYSEWQQTRFNDVKKILNQNKGIQVTKLGFKNLMKLKQPIIDELLEGTLKLFLVEDYNSYDDNFAEREYNEWINIAEDEDDEPVVTIENQHTVERDD